MDIKQRTNTENKKLYDKLGFVPWDPAPIMQAPGGYKIVISGRSDGKTYGAITLALKQYIEDGKTTVYLRRWDFDIKGRKGEEIVSGLTSDGSVTLITGGEWDRIVYRNRKWYLARPTDKTGDLFIADDPFMYAYAVSQVEHDKGTFIPNLGMIIYDEFIAMGCHYLTDEFVLFANSISTFLRYRGDVNIFMLANSIDYDNPYFIEMGLDKIKKQEPGTISVYSYDGGTEVAVERLHDTDQRLALMGYAPTGGAGKPSDKYFAGFQNPKLAMITGGAWQIPLYPHLPEKYKPNQVLFTYWILWRGECYQCEIIHTEDDIFQYIHPKTTPLKEKQLDLIYDPEQKPGAARRTNVLKPRTPVESRLAELFIHDRTYYSNNTVGDAIQHYLQWCREG